MLRGEYVHTRAQVLNADGSEVVADTRDIPVTDHASGAATFAAELRERGAAELIASATREIEGAGDDG
jgi:hydroxymethylbilane synthase